uniref:Uncharacterized protein n=1 Tax=Arundo donax TaxID=35708 RepID=A0A0A9C2L7_ARUDO
MDARGKVESARIKVELNHGVPNFGSAIDSFDRTNSSHGMNFWTG